MGSKDRNKEAGLLYERAPGQSLKLRFNEILIESLTQHFKLRKDELPKDFAHKKNIEGKSLIEQRSSLYSFEKFENIKTSAFNAVGAVYVRNSVIWPANNYDFPALIYDSAETKGWLFILLDFHPMRRDELYLKHYSEPLAEIKEKYKNIPLLGGSRTQLREWTREYSSKYPFYFRCPKEYEEKIEQGFKEYLNLYIEKVKEATPIENPELLTEVLEFKNKFKSAYAENDPGGGLYRKFFGEEWTERFLHEFLFA